MTIEEFNTLATDAISNIGDAGIVSAKIDNMRTAFNESNTNIETLSTKITELEKMIENLKESNMQLFLKVGEKVENIENDVEKPDVKVITFDELFDESGELK